MKPYNMTNKHITGIFKRFYTGSFSRQDEKRLLETQEVDLMMQAQWEHPEEPKDRQAEPDYDAVFRLIEERAYKGTGFRRFPFYRVAAGLVLLAGLSVALYFLLQKNSVDKQLQFSTVAGEIRTFALPDGSQICLGERSRVSFSGDFVTNRVLDMEGLAFYKVVKNNTPFRVNAGELTIEVTGTSFSVSNYASAPEIEAILLEGIIRVKDNKGSFTRHLMPDEKISFNKRSGSYLITHVNARELTLWKEPRLVFNNTSLAEIAATLSKRYGVSFNVEEGASSHKFTFTLGRESLQESLQLISSLAPVEARQTNDTIMLSLRK